MPTVCLTFSLRLIHPSWRSICIRVHGRGRGAAHQPDCFSLKDEMVFLQIVTFRRRFMGPCVVVGEDPVRGLRHKTETGETGWISGALLIRPARSFAADVQLSW